MKIMPPQLSDAIHNGKALPRWLLICGSDSAMVEESSRLAIQHYKKQYPGLDIESTTAALIQKGDYNLGDAMRSMSLLGDKTLIHIRQVTDKFHKAIEPLLTQESDAIILLSGESIATKAKLFTLFSGMTDGWIVPCYPMEVRDAQQYIARYVMAKGLQIDQEAVQSLVHHCGTDVGVLHQEIDKLLLYAADQKRITLESVESVVQDAPSQVSDALFESLLKRDPAAMSHILHQLQNNKMAPVQFLRGLLFQLNRLAQIRGRVDHSVPLDQAMGQCKPPIFFKQKPLFKQYMGKWNMQQVRQAMHVVQRLERDSKRMSESQSYARSLQLLSRL